MSTITRSLLFSVELANTGKKRFVYELWEEYKKVILKLLKVGVKKKKLVYEDVKPVETWLSARYKSTALKQAQDILKSWLKKKKKRNDIKDPEVKRFSMKLDSRFFKLEKGENSFDYWLFVREPREERWVKFPIKSYQYAKGFFESWKMAKFIEILEKNGKLYVKLIFKKDVELQPKEPKGLDIGYRKLITTSDGEVYGSEVKEIIENRIDRKKQGSKNFKRAKHFFKTEINRILKEVIDGSFSPVIEGLKNLKKGKAKKWARGVNRKFNHWIYSYVLRRIRELCEVAGVQYHVVPAQNTSRTCPRCGCVDKENRKGERFQCVRCSYSADADYVGAVNILRRFSGEPIVPPACETSFYGIKNKCLWKDELYN